MPLFPPMGHLAGAGLRLRSALQSRGASGSIGASLVLAAALFAPSGAATAQAVGAVAQATSTPPIFVAPSTPPGQVPTHARRVPAAPWDASRLSNLARPDTLILIRHANAPGVGDPDNFDINDCRSQRNLDDAGRDQAEALGNAWKTAGIFPSRIFTSAWCRCVDTALRLKMGPIAILAELNSFWEKETARASQTARLKDFIYRLDPKGGPYVMVTHQVNITALSNSVVSSAGGVVVQLGRETGLVFEDLPSK